MSKCHQDGPDINCDESVVLAFGEIIVQLSNRQSPFQNPNSLMSQIRYHQNDLWEDDENYDRYEAGGKEKANTLKDSL